MIENLKKEKQSIKSKKSNKGITLIALVITIIVLLILAGVAISTLTGENGILQKVNDAKTKTEEAENRERIQLQMLASVDNDGKYNKNKAIENIEKYLGLTVESGDVTKNGEGLTVKLNGYEFPVTKDGVVGEGKEIEKTKTIAEVKAAGTIFDKETTIIDSYRNKVVIPEGFKIASDSATEVAQGVVIEDARYTNTKGSQFVWIPVGTVTGEVKGIEKTETIKLSRYTFDEEGKETDKGDDKINSYYEDLSESGIEAFKSSANNNGGYYLGRYEAGITGDCTLEDYARRWIGTNMKLVCTAGEQVYNYVTQPQALDLSRNMYTSETFTSDLINSYAWDTAIVFIQKFGEESNSSTYSKTLGLSDTSINQIQTAGTNILKATGKTDRQCNIFDMSGNTLEWSTEKYSVYRGGYYKDTYCNTSYRSNTLPTVADSYDHISFRPILYL